MIKTWERTFHISWTRVGLGALQILAFTTLTALAAHIRIPLPFTPVPITLQSLVVILAGIFLGSKKGATSQIALILAGFLGFSVFSQSGPAYAVVLGPTGGYILGFVFAAYVAGWMKEHLELQGFWSRSLALFGASLFIFIPGVFWLKIFTGQNWGLALSLGLYPFLLGDILKTLVAAGLWKGQEDFKKYRS